MHFGVKEAHSLFCCGRFVSHNLLQQNPYNLHRYCVHRQVKHFLRQLHKESSIVSDQLFSIPCCSHRNFVSIFGRKYHSSQVHKTKNLSNQLLVNLEREHKPLSLRTSVAQFVTAHDLDASSKFSMSNPVFADYLEGLVAEYDALQDEQKPSSDAVTSSDRHSQQSVSRLSFLRSATAVIEKLKAKHQEMTELSSLLNNEADSEMQKMLESELVLYKDDLQEIEEELIDVLVGDDPADNSDIMLEVTAGVGGQEAMLFCLEIFNMYCNYAVRNGWQLAEPVSDTSSEQGGARKARVEISGQGVYRQLKHEGGVHRVQRVPKTERAGRIHTSTITVSVMPLPKEIDLDIQQKDLKVETFRNSGPGGQSVNTTDSAVRITHIPTGTVAEGKEERSQIKNRDIAMKKLKQRMYESILAEQQAQIRESRRLQQGTRARSEKIRTYNFQQDRITDHRTRENTSNLSQFLMFGGEGLDGLINGLIQQERYHTMELLLEGWEGGNA